MSLQEELRQQEAKFQDLRLLQGRQQEEYLVHFNEMTQLLMNVVQTREEESKSLSQSRDELKDSLQKFNDMRWPS